MAPLFFRVFRTSFPLSLSCPLTLSPYRCSPFLPLFFTMTIRQPAEAKPKLHPSSSHSNSYLIIHYLIRFRASRSIAAAPSKFLCWTRPLQCPNFPVLPFPLPPFSPKHPLSHPAALLFVCPTNRPIMTNYSWPSWPITTQFCPLLYHDFDLPRPVPAVLDPSRLTDNVIAPARCCFL